MKNWKLNIFKTIAILLMLTLSVVTLVGCGGDGTGDGGNGGNGGQTPEGPKGWKDPEVYTYSTYTAVSPSNWNELTYKDNNDTQIMGYIGSSFFSYDFKFDANGEIIPGEFEMKYEAARALEDVTSDYVGDEWGIPEGATQRAWKITLRDDLKWQNGDPIKAEDFVYTMKEQLDPEFEAYRADSFYIGSTILHNAQNYFKQGEIVDETVSNLYGTLSEALAAHPGAVYLDVNASAKQVNSWLGYSGYPLTTFDRAGILDDAFALYAGEGDDRAPIMGEDGKPVNFFEKYGLLGGATQVLVTDEMIADYNSMDAWNPSAELEMGGLSIVKDYEYPVVDFSKVGIKVGNTPEELIIILDKALPLLKEDGSLSYKAAYNFSSLPLVHKATYEALKKAPTAEGGEWTTTYNTSVETTMSWGPYKLAKFQTGKYYEVVRNTEWFGYNVPENDNLYQTDVIACETIVEWQTAWVKFLAGEIDGIGIDVSVADEYKGSDRAYFTPDDFVASLQLQSDSAQLEARESEGVDKQILTNVKFRKALSLSINRQDFATKTTTSSKAGFGLFNSMHYYDVENGKVFRNEDVARQVLCDVYGVDASQFGSLTEAEASITGYDLAQARQLLTEAYNETVEAGLMKATDKVELTFGTSVTNEVVTRRHNYIKDAWTNLAVGTPLEGKLVFSADAELGDAWADDFRAGKYDVCMGGWSGAAWDPGYFLLAYLSPDYMYSTAWDTSSQQMTFTMKGVKDEEGNDISDTMSLMDWYDCLNGTAGAKYDFSSAALEEALRLQLIAALEKEVLVMYYSVPLYNSFGASLISYKLDYITYEYNTFMGYGGIKYASYNYSDTEWAAEVAAQDNELDYH